MKFKKKDKVINILTGKECIIVGTKESPYKPKNNLLGQKEIKPEDGYEYLIMTKISGNDNEVNYSGLTSIMENELNKTINNDY